MNQKSNPFTLVVYTADDWEHVCPRIRVVEPARLNGFRVIKGSEWENGTLREYPDRISEADVVLIQRNFPSYTDEYERVFDYARTLGKFVVYEIDDLLPELPEQHPDYYHYLTARTAILKSLVEADAVITSTPALHDYVDQFNSKVWVLPNYLDDTIWTLRDVASDDRSPVIIGYMGGYSHSYDLELITLVLERLLRKYGRRIMLRFWGVAPPAVLQDKVNVEWIDLGLVDYSQFASYFIKQECDIFIAPLQDNLFNRCKSNIKFLEYSALGVPGVYSRINPYEDVVVNGVNGYLASSSGEWEESLIKLIEDPSLRERLGKEAQLTVSANWLLSAHLKEWSEFYGNLPSIERKDQNRDVALKVAQKAHDWQRGLEQLVQDTDIEKKEISHQRDELMREASNLRNALEIQRAFVQHVQGVYFDILNSTSWRLLLKINWVRFKLVPRGGFVDRVLKWGLQGLRTLHREGFSAFVQVLIREAPSILKSQSVMMATTDFQQDQIPLSHIVKDGYKCPSPAISVVILKELYGLEVNTDQVCDWVQRQSCSSLVEIVVWNKESGKACYLEDPKNEWEAIDFKTFCRELVSRYICIGSKDLIQQYETYLEANLIALETESLVFTVNLQGQAQWAISRLRNGDLPGNKEYPLQRMVVNKDYLVEDFRMDLDPWLAKLHGFPSVVGKILTHTTNKHDEEGDLPFESKMLGYNWLVAGQNILMLPTEEIPLGAITHILNPVDTVLPITNVPSSLPTILMVMQFLAVGGAERLAIDVIRSLKHQFRFIIIGVENPDSSLGTTADEFYRETPFTYTIPDYLESSLTSSFMRYIIQRFDPITLFIENGSNRIYDPLLELKNQFPDLRIINQVYDHQVGWINRYDLDLLMAIDAHIAANQNIEQAYIDQGVRPEDVYFIEHGIDPDLWDPEKYSQDKIEGLKGKLGLPLGKKIVTFIARMHPQKRPMDFVELARRFSSDPSVCFLMVGDGPLAGKVDEQIAKLGLENMNRLNFYRPSSEIFALTDVLVLPSEYEAMPLVVSETQAMGKPVVVTDVGNNRKVVELTGGGVVVSQVGDVAALMDGVRKMLVSPPDPEQTRKAILSRYGIQAISKLYADAFLNNRNG